MAHKNKEVKVSPLNMLITERFIKNFGSTDDPIIKELIRMTDKHKSEEGSEASNNKSAQPQQPLHFDFPFPPEQQKILYDGLIAVYKDGTGFLHPKTTYSHFCHVFGGTKIPDYEKPFEPLCWLQDLQDLKMFVNTFLEEENKKWKKTVSCFSYNGQSINDDSIRNLNPLNKKLPCEEHFKKLEQEIRKTLRDN